MGWGRMGAGFAIWVVGCLRYSRFGGHPPRSCFAGTPFYSPSEKGRMMVGAVIFLAWFWVLRFVGFC